MNPRTGASVPATGNGGVMYYSQPKGGGTIVAKGNMTTYNTKSAIWPTCNYYVVLFDSLYDSLPATAAPGFPSKEGWDVLNALGPAWTICSCLNEPTSGKKLFRCRNMGALIVDQPIVNLAPLGGNWAAAGGGDIVLIAPGQPFGPQCNINGGVAPYDQYTVINTGACFANPFAYIPAEAGTATYYPGDPFYDYINSWVLAGNPLQVTGCGWGDELLPWGPVSCQITYVH